MDIRPDTQNIDETLIEAAITDRTRAICVVHYAGVACEMDAIMEIAGRHRLYVIEDAAQGVGSCYRGRRLGSIGHLGCYSFHETKNVISGEGGALLVNDPSLMERAEIIREKGPTVPGFPRAGGQIHLGGRRFLLSARRDDRRLFVCPAGTRAGDQRGKAEVVEYVPPRAGSIGRTGVLRRPCIPEHCTHNAHMYYVLLRSMEERTRLINKLAEHGIKAVFHYIPLHSSPAGMRFGRSAGAMPHTDRTSDTLLRLPLYYDLGEEGCREVLRAGFGLEGVES